jgi:hypothetical protein
MSAINAPKNPIVNWEIVRDEWIARLNALVETVQTWSQELGWSTRRIERRMEDSQLGTYQAPALLLQEGTTRVLLEPVARFAPGAEGVVDLYTMPAYDDIATLYFHEAGWHLSYLFPGMSAPILEGNPKPLLKNTFQEVLEALTKHAA